MLYTLHVDNYATDSFGCACVKTTREQKEAKNDRAIKMIASRRKDVSKIVRPDGTVVMADGGYPYGTSRYCVGV